MTLLQENPATTTDRRPRIGLVGAGVISHAHMPALLDLGREVVVFSEVGAPELVAAHGAGTVVPSFEELLERVDVVDVATPTFTHAGYVAAALRAGKDVISEKPLARTDEDAAALTALAADLGRTLYPAQVVRFFPEYAHLKASVDSGRLGDLAVLRFSRSGAYPTRTPWFADVALSGGIVLDQMIHDLDIARWVAGEVVQVSAVSRTAGTAQEPVAGAHVLLTHASGAISQVSGIWGPPHLAFTTSFSVAGTLGTLSHDSAAERGFSADLRTAPGSGGLMPDVDPAESPYYVELREFIGALSGGPAARVTAADGAEAVRIGNAALASIDTGQPVALTPTTTPAEG
ncbi:Gfo/Idh/MocA family protein [Kineococcus sp. SYSU DK002]|uniref:Gfo/Idh/MocA family protein n=1 Tax=Kineococcus sp. SYSU DK002 TaxID=3383123 RepID=UPI003D7E4E86